MNDKTEGISDDMLLREYVDLVNSVLTYVDNSRLGHWQRGERIRLLGKQVLDLADRLAPYEGPNDDDDEAYETQTREPK